MVGIFCFHNFKGQTRDVAAHSSPAATTLNFIIIVTSHITINNLFIFNYYVPGISLNKSLTTPNTTPTHRSTSPLTTSKTTCISGISVRSYYLRCCCSSTVSYWIPISALQFHPRRCLHCRRRLPDQHYLRRHRLLSGPEPFFSLGGFP